MARVDKRQWQTGCALALALAYSLGGLGGPPMNAAYSHKSYSYLMWP